MCFVYGIWIGAKLYGLVLVNLDFKWFVSTLSEFTFCRFSICKIIYYYILPFIRWIEIERLNVGSISRKKEKSKKSSKPSVNLAENKKPLTVLSVSGWSFGWSHLGLNQGPTDYECYQLSFRRFHWFVLLFICSYLPNTYIIDYHCYS